MLFSSVQFVFNKIFIRDTLSIFTFMVNFMFIVYMGCFKCKLVSLLKLKKIVFNSFNSIFGLFIYARGQALVQEYLPALQEGEISGGNTAGKF